MKKLNTLKHNVKKKTTPYVIKSKNYKCDQNHYIFSDPRGGSTWLMEIIQNITKEPVIWEPLHLNINNTPFNALKFGWRQYIPESEEWPEAQELFAKLFSGKILTQDILKQNSFFTILKSNSLLFKICRGNALLPWLCNNFNFKNKPIYLIRHPFAVVSSQLRHGAWNNNSETYTIPDTPYNEIYKKHEVFLKSLNTKEEILVANWCISNAIPLNSMDNNKKWITITYESLVMNPEKICKHILNVWNTDYDISSIAFQKNSATTQNDSPENILQRLSNWQSHLSVEQQENMSKVLDYFKVTLYSKSKPLPEYTFLEL